MGHDTNKYYSSHVYFSLILLMQLTKFHLYYAQWQFLCKYLLELKDNKTEKLIVYAFYISYRLPILYILEVTRWYDTYISIRHFLLHCDVHCSFHILNEV